jgi:predicted protein tyrosine phosphatase
MNLPFRVTICGLDELARHAGARVSHVLSILDPYYPVPEIFGTYGEHVKLELRFDDVIEDSPIAPMQADVEKLLAFGRSLDAKPAADAHLLVHCHAGVSRSSASTALLIAQALPAASGDEIFEEILRIRPQIWPNLRIIEMGDRLLGRNGQLVAAVQKIYRRQIEADPTFEDFRRGGRAREVDLALADPAAKTSETRAP